MIQKSFLLTCLLLSVLPSFAQVGDNVNAKATAGTGSRLISSVYFINDGSNYVYYDSMAMSYFGTRSGDLTHLLKYDNAVDYLYNTTTSIFDNRIKRTQTFDANNNITTLREMMWSTATSSWVNSYNYIFTYDASNNRQTLVTQQWNTSSMSWDNLYKNLYTYDAANNQLTNITQAWSSATSTWENSTKESNAYNAANKITQTVRQSWNGISSSWDNDYRISNTYDANNNMITLLKENWNTITSAWDKYYKHTNTFGPSNEELTDLLQYWNSATSTWDNNGMTFFRDFTGAAGNLYKTMVTTTWNTSTSVFDSSRRYQYTYNNYDQTLTFFRDSWNIGGFWQATGSDYGSAYHYEEYATQVKGLTAQNGTANIYPVPAKNVLNIDLNWDEAQPFTISIIDLQGRVSRQWQVTSTASYKTAVSVADLPFGTYIIKIDGSKGQVIKQLIISPQ